MYHKIQVPEKHYNVVAGLKSVFWNADIIPLYIYINIYYIIYLFINLFNKLSDSFLNLYKRNVKNDK